MHNLKIHVKQGAQIVQVTEGRGLPQYRVVGQGGIDTMGELLQDEATGDSCYEFRFQGKIWTVDVDQVEVR